MYAFVDWDVQEFHLLDITINGTSDLLFVSSGMNGFECRWWQNPTTDWHHGWYRDGLLWMADQMDAHHEAR